MEPEVGTSFLLLYYFVPKVKCYSVLLIVIIIAVRPSVRLEISHLNVFFYQLKFHDLILCPVYHDVDM